MKCNDARQRWHRRLDQNSLDAELDQHLAACAECRTYAARMQRLVGLMDELREDTERLAPPANEEVLYMTPGRQPKWVTPSARNLLRIAAAVLVTVSVGLWYGIERNPTAVDQNSISVMPSTGITLRAESGERFMAVAAPSPEPNVQTFWLYPRVTAAESQDRS